MKALFQLLCIRKNVLQISFVIFKLFFVAKPIHLTRFCRFRLILMNRWLNRFGFDLRVTLQLFMQFRATQVYKTVYGVLYHPVDKERFVAYNSHLTLKIRSAWSYYSIDFLEKSRQMLLLLFNTIYEQDNVLFDSSIYPVVIWSSSNFIALLIHKNPYIRLQKKKKKET